MENYLFILSLSTIDRLTSSANQDLRAYCILLTLLFTNNARKEREQYFLWYCTKADTTGVGRPRKQDHHSGVCGCSCHSHVHFKFSGQRSFSHLCSRVLPSLLLALLSLSCMYSTESSTKVSHKLSDLPFGVCHFLAWMTDWRILRIPSVSSEDLKFEDYSHWCMHPSLIYLISTWKLRRSRFLFWSLHYKILKSLH
jgi:hypothetical protein